jgi:glycine hydroxymethyltransferase
VAAGVFPSPLPHAHVVTTTTHKTLRGPRGGLILSNDRKLGRKIDAAVFPGLQGGPLMHVIAAKAVAFGEAQRPDFKIYAQRVIDNARALADAVAVAGMKVVAGGTDSHLMVVDLTPKDVSGKAAEDSLGRADITCSRSTIPFDPRPPAVSSGVRLGTPACTTRGFGPCEFRRVGQLIGEVVDGLAANGEAGNGEVEAKVRAAVRDLTERFPIYS